MTSVGIVGFGSFGALVADMLKDIATVRVYSRTAGKVPVPLRASLAEACRCDYLVLCVPLDSYTAVLTDVARHIAPQTVMVDVCSVKVKPIQLIADMLPHNPRVATHPLFGPQTVQRGLGQHVMVICDDVSDTKPANAISGIAAKAGLQVVHMSAAGHDKQMANVHALTFFIARALLNMSFDDVVLKTPSFERLLSLVELEQHHSQELFDTIEKGNPFAAEVRDQFVQEVKRLAAELDR